MSVRITLATTRRILRQLRHDPRTVALMLVVPVLLMVLLRYMLASEQAFSRVAPALLAIFPFLVMFLVTSVATLRERTTGTLERLMTMPIAKLDLLCGYALAFGGVAVVQVGIVTGVCVGWLGMDVTGSIGLLLLVALLDAVLGVAFGLFVSAFARTEFQAVQFMPLVVLPQALLCGLFVPRSDMAQVLDWLSWAMPLTYAVQALQRVTGSAEVTGVLIRDLLVIAGCALVALVLGAMTLRRRTD